VDVMLKDMPTIEYAFGLNNTNTTTSSSTISTDNANREPAAIAPESSTPQTVGKQSRVEAGSVYILPPVYYPQTNGDGGKWYIKIGGGPNEYNDAMNTSRDELDKWLQQQSEGDPKYAVWLEGIL